MKSEEKMFFIFCIALNRFGFNVRKAVDILDKYIPRKRLWYYLDKWSNLGFYDYGVTLDLGWFYIDKLPARYKELL